jgi:hypothetical protein
MPPSPYVPFFRRFTDERAVDLADTIALYNEVRRTFQASLWSGDVALEAFGRVIIDEIGELVDLPASAALREELFLCLSRILGAESVVFAFPDIDWSSAVLSLKDQVQLRRSLRARQHFLADDERGARVLSDVLRTVFAGIIANLPTVGDSGTASWSVPLYAMLDVHDVVDRVIGTCTHAELMDCGLLVELNEQIYRNVCAASKLVPYEDHKRPFVTAADSELPAEELVETYLRGTPFRDLFTADVPLAIPDKAFREHAAIFAPSGHGKTQLLQNLICQFIDTPDPPAMFIMDSQGDMLRKIESLEVFSGRLRDRLIILDPEDVLPPALNFFQMGTRGRSYDPQVNELFSYLFAAIDSDLTAKQGTAVTYLLKLMRALPSATIETLKDVMEEPVKGLEASRYATAIAGLDRITQDFFRNQFFDKSAMGGTRQQVARRLYTILGNPKFVEMFAAKENRFSARAAMEEKKIVLVNTSQRLLGQEASAVFGRFFIAQCLAAAYERADLPEAERHLAVLVIDEASEYFDAKTERILSQARKYGLGLVFATQYLDQMPLIVKAAMNANTAIKLAGPVGSSDAMMLAREMYTSGEFIRSMRARDQQYAEFACHVRGLTSAAVRLTVSYGVLERQPRMDDAMREALREANRRRYGRQAAPPAPSSPPPLPSADPTDFGDAY